MYNVDRRSRRCVIRSPELCTLTLGFCAAQDDREHKWRVQAVSKAAGSFESRKPLPAVWQGLRDEALSELSGIPGCVFVHASGFIGGNSTREGAIEMARQGLTME